MCVLDPHRKQQRISGASLFLQCLFFCLAWSLPSSPASGLSCRYSDRLSTSLLCLDLHREEHGNHKHVADTLGAPDNEIVPTFCAWDSLSWSGQSCRRYGSSGHLEPPPPQWELRGRRNTPGAYEIVFLLQSSVSNTNGTCRHWPSDWGRPRGRISAACRTLVCH